MPRRKQRPWGLRTTTTFEYDLREEKIRFVFECKNNEIRYFLQRGVGVWGRSPCPRSSESKTRSPSACTRASPPPPYPSKKTKTAGEGLPVELLRGFQQACRGVPSRGRPRYEHPRGRGGDAGGPRQPLGFAGHSSRHHAGRHGGTRLLLVISFVVIFFLVIKNPDFIISMHT